MKIVLIKVLAPTVEGYKLDKWIYTQPLFVVEETEDHILVKHKWKIPTYAWFDKKYVDRYI